MIEGDSADMCAGKFPLVSIGGRAEGLACEDPGEGPPSALTEISIIFSKNPKYLILTLKNLILFSELSSMGSGI